MMKLLQEYKKIGTIHLLIQAVAFIVMTKGMALLFLQALSESPGWVMLALWLVFNFFVIVVVVNLLDLLLPSFLHFALLVTIIKILAVALIGGGVSYLFDLVYYKYQCYYIGEQFNLNDFKDNFWSFMIYIPPVIALGELIRRNTGILRIVRLSNR